MKRATIDWARVHIQLQEIHAGLEEAFAASPKRIEDVYRRRAVRLAKARVDPLSSPGLPVMIVWLGRERYAIELKHVTEVMPFAHCTPMPGASPEFAGVISVRGELRLVLDLGRLLALAEHATAEPVPGEPASGEKDTRDSGFVLMLRHRNREIGLRIDRAEELRELRTEELAHSVQGSYLKGLGFGTLMLLDTEAMLDDVLSREETE